MPAKELTIAPAAASTRLARARQLVTEMQQEVSRLPSAPAPALPAVTVADGIAGAIERSIAAAVPYNRGHASFEAEVEHQDHVAGTMTTIRLKGEFSGGDRR